MPPSSREIDIGKDSVGIDPANPIDIEFLIGAYLLAVLNFDRRGKIEFSTAVNAGHGKTGAPYAPGTALEDVFSGEGLEASAQLAHDALNGRGGQTELTFATPGGSQVLRLSFMPREAAGRPDGFVTVAANVTARRAEVARLAALEDRVRAILDHIADGVVVIDAAGRIEGLNQAAADLAGRSIEALKGLRINEIMTEPYRSAHQSHIQRYLETGKSGILNVRPRRLPMLRADGAVIPVELSIGEAWIGGQRKFIGLIRDLTQTLRQEEVLIDANAELKARVAGLEAESVDLEAQKLALERLAAATQKAREAAEAANRAKSRFVATVSHELRTPLNGILAVSDMLARRDLSPDALQMAELIQRSGRSLLSLLNDILDMAKVEAGLLQVRQQPFRPHEVLREVMQMWTAPAEARSVRLSLQAEGLPEAVNGDPERLRQILSNLINNALKFTDGQEVALSVEIVSASGDARRLRFAVADQGPGIAPALREKIFEPFVQAESGDARPHPGSGLGLTICRELATLMGGRIWAEAHGERGTAMVVEIDFALAEPPAAPAGPAAASAPIATPQALDLLVAEDHPANRQVMALILEEAGWRWQFALDGREAVEKAAAGGFDAVLMDLQMPLMDGLSATQAIRALPGEANALPVIGVTASASLEELDRCRQAGMDEVVTKPIDPARLIEVVSRCVGRAAHRRQ